MRLLLLKSKPTPASPEALDAAIVASLGGALEPAELSAEDRAALLAKVMARIATAAAPAAAAGTVNVRAAEGKNCAMDPGVGFVHNPPSAEPLGDV